LRGLPALDSKSQEVFPAAQITTSAEESWFSEKKKFTFGTSCVEKKKRGCGKGAGVFGCANVGNTQSDTILRI